MTTELRGKSVLITGADRGIGKSIAVAFAKAGARIAVHGLVERDEALPLIAEDPTRVPDHLLSGPDLPADEAVRRRFFGED